MNIKNFNLLSFVIFLYTAIFCNNIMAQTSLKSWNEGAIKSKIIAFVTKTTDPESKDFIDIKDRIATFDNDGTLWSEKPFYFQFFFALDQIKKLSLKYPEWKHQQPYKAVLENDQKTIAQFQSNDLLNILLAAHATDNAEDLEKNIVDWMKNSSHPKFNRPYNQLIFQPMLELLDFLREKKYKIFIVSGGSIEFIRAWAEEAYDIPKDQIIGTSIKGEFRISANNDARIAKLPEINFIDDHEGKPVAIERFIGRRPVISVGNSDGDLEMMQYTASGDGPRLMLYVHHTDSEREWAYDRISHTGKLDKGLDEAKKRGWSVIDMKQDWKTVFPFEHSPEIKVND